MQLSGAGEKSLFTFVIKKRSNVWDIFSEKSGSMFYAKAIAFIKSVTLVSIPYH